jgi:hypothetical protein
MSKTTLSKTEIEILEKEIPNIYLYHYEKSIEYLKKLIKIRQKIKNNKKTNMLLNSQEEFLSLCANFHSMKCDAIYIICDKIIYDIKLKNNLLRKFIDVKKYYVSVIKNML